VLWLSPTLLICPLLRLSSRSPAETKRIGQRLARNLKPGDVVLLEGELGAGKTCFAQGIGKGLQVAEAVKSSSFVLVNEYNGRLKVYHADLFRLGSPDEIADLALEENGADGLLLVEWPDRAPSEMPPEHLRVRFSIEDEGGRTLELTAQGKRYEDLVTAFAAALEAPSKGR
jgi:tRNA threonylcarbamoyladenosine biosynthesis protein TsaE